MLQLHTESCCMSFLYHPWRHIYLFIYYYFICSFKIACHFEGFMSLWSKGLVISWVRLYNIAMLIMEWYVSMLMIISTSFLCTCLTLELFLNAQFCFEPLHILFNWYNFVSLVIHIQLHVIILPTLHIHVYFHMWSFVQFSVIVWTRNNHTYM